MEKKFFDIKKISRLAKKNLLMVLLALFVCVGVSLSAYFGSEVTGAQDGWKVAITHVPPTPTPALIPDTGWWSTVATPTSQSKP